MPEHDRNFVYSRTRRRCTTANEDWSGCPIRRGHVVMSKGNEQNGLINVRIDQTDPTWEARLLIGRS